jgi:hypothetical protein
MPRKRKLLHVRQHLENTVEMCEYLLAHKPGEAICPAMRDWLVQNKLVGKAILRKADEAKARTGKRADLYVEVRS